jgi:chemotaxis protein CheY-P-specific phosphatase CheC
MTGLTAYGREKLMIALKKCSSNAASALSTMIQSEVYPDANSIFFKIMDDLFMLPSDNIVVISDITGDLSGTMIASFKCEHGMKILNKMLQRDENIISDLGEEEVSALKEYINIVGGSFLSTLGNELSIKCFADVPNFEGKFDEISKVMEEQLRALNTEILFVNSSLQIPSIKADAVFYVLFDQESLLVLEIAINNYHPPE